MRLDWKFCSLFQEPEPQCFVSLFIYVHTMILRSCCCIEHKYYKSNNELVQRSQSTEIEIKNTINRNENR